MDPTSKPMRDRLLRERRLDEDQSDVIREQTVHLCQCQATIDDQVVQNFVRNFKILFIKGDDLLFKNPNL